MKQDIAKERANDIVKSNRRSCQTYDFVKKRSLHSIERMSGAVEDPVCLIYLPASLGVRTFETAGDPIRQKHGVPLTVIHPQPRLHYSSESRLLMVGCHVVQQPQQFSHTTADILF